MSSTVSILIIRVGQYVLQHRDAKEGIAYPDSYGVWGGAVEEDDVSIEAAAIRELQEETGLHITASELTPLGTQVWDGNSAREAGKKVTFYYFAIHLPAAANIDVREGQGLVALDMPYVHNEKVNVVTAAVIERYESLQQS